MPVFKEKLQELYTQSLDGRIMPELAQHEPQYHPWLEYNGSLTTYNELFLPVFRPGEKLETIAQKSLTEKGSFIGIDLCGQGDFLAELGATAGLSVCLGHDYKRCQEPTGTIVKIDADLLLNQSWERIDQWIADHGKPDLVVCAPGSGNRYFFDWQRENTFPKYHDYQYHTYSRATFFALLWKITDILAENGVLLLDFQHSEKRFLWLQKSRQYWLENPNLYQQLPGNIAVDVNLKEGVLAIRKIPAANNPTITRTTILKT